MPVFFLVRERCLVHILTAVVCWCWHAARWCFRNHRLYGTSTWGWIRRPVHGVGCRRYSRRNRGPRIRAVRQLPLRVLCGLGDSAGSARVGCRSPPARTATGWRARDLDSFGDGPEGPKKFTPRRPIPTKPSLPMSSFHSSDASMKASSSRCTAILKHRPGHPALSDLSPRSVCSPPSRSWDAVRRIAPLHMAQGDSVV